MSTIGEATEFLELFARAKRSVGRVVWKAFAPLDVGPKQVILMREIARTRAISQADLARATATDPAAASRAVQSLIALGWVRRERNKKNQRELTVTVTAAGRAASKRIETTYAGAARRITVTLDARDLADFRRIADKVLRRCNDLGSKTTDDTDSISRARRRSSS